MGAPFSAPWNPDRVKILFQPILEVHPDSLIFKGFEALARDPNAGGGPDDPRLEDPERDLQCLDLALAAAVPLPSTASLFFNVGLPTLAQVPQFYEIFLGWARQHGLRPDRLTLEIAARRSPADWGRLVEEARALKKHKVRLALDDFGQGACNLDLLPEIRPDLLKLSPALTRGLMDDLGRQLLLESLVNLGHRLGAAILVKDLESPRHFRVARWLGRGRSRATCSDGRNRRNSGWSTRSRTAVPWAGSCGPIPPSRVRTCVRRAGDLSWVRHDLS
ncbi:MAG: EAL domain-containing protein [Holophaga sp.]|jgi:EAL domain-containing protein (putative c-di-GMP-specific phosphodiesterase class I)